MATVTGIISRAPSWAQSRYSTTYYLRWINELLEELSGEGTLMKELSFESGVEVNDKIWINPPSGLRSITRISNPQNSDQRFNWETVNNRIKLIGVTLDSQESPDTATAFQNYTTTYIDVNIADAAEDDYKGSLLVVTAGTYLNRTFVISRNDVSSGGYTRVYFLHPLTSALSVTRITACKFISPAYYLMLKWSGSYEEVVDGADEIPIDNKYERRVIQAWLDWKFHEEVDRSSKQCRAAQGSYYDVVSKVKMELRGDVGGRTKPRDLPGLIQYAAEGKE
jgi:hypothetical protein